MPAHINSSEINGLTNRSFESDELDVNISNLNRSRSKKKNKSKYKKKTKKHDVEHNIVEDVVDLNSNPIDINNNLTNNNDENLNNQIAVETFETSSNYENNSFIQSSISHDIRIPKNVNRQRIDSISSVTSVKHTIDNNNYVTNYKRLETISKLDQDDSINLIFEDSDDDTQGSIIKPSLEVGQILYDLDPNEKLGSGAFGNVYKCVDKNTGDPFVVKVYNDSLNVIEQFNIMRRIRHKNLVRVFGCDKVENGFRFRTQYSEGFISLKTYIKSEEVYEVKDKVMIAKGVLEGIRFLHRKHIMHRDIKSDNVIINTNDETPKIIDYDFIIKLSKNDHDSYVVGTCGTASHMAPEVWFKNKPYTYSADLYSFGCLVLELYTPNQRSIWIDTNGDVIPDKRIYYRLVRLKEKPPYPPNLEKPTIDLINKCLENDPIKRCRKAGKLLKHKFFNTVKLKNST